MRKISIITILTVAVVLAVINFLAARHPVRIDLTDTGVYTLSDSTKKMVRDLKDVLTVRVYFSEQVPPALLGVRRDVDDLLSELKEAGNGKIQIEHIDPSASAMDEQRAALMGIMPVQLNVYSGDKVEVAKVYLGISLLYGGKQEVIPVVYSAANLEYELAEAIIKVSSDKLTRIGWWEGRNVEDEVSPYRLVRDALSRRFDVADMGKGEVVDMDPANLSAVILVSPRKMSDSDLFAIDQYLMKGGRLMALIDRTDVNAQLKLTPVETDAPAMLAHYGAAIGDDLVLDESAATAAFTGGPVTYHIPYPLWPEVPAAGFNKDSPITVNIQSAVFPWTASLTLSEDETGAWIARSSLKSASLPDEGASMEPKAATDALAKSQQAEQTISAMLTGPFKSFFSGTGRTAPRGEAVIAEGSEHAAIFVTGSSRWIMDKFLMNFPQNINLFQNALDHMSMSDSLVGIRSRDEIRRPIALMPDAARSFLRYANIAIGPLAVGVIGVATGLMRRRRRKKIEAKFRKAA